jgi:uncharacterized membrane protein
MKEANQQKVYGVGTETTRRSFIKNWVNWLWMAPAVISAAFLFYQFVFPLPEGKQATPTTLLSLLFIVVGLCIAAFCALSGRKAWTKNSNEYSQWVRSEAYFRWEYFLISIYPKSVRLWGDRILYVIGLAMGVLFVLLGASHLWLKMAG